MFNTYIADPVFNILETIYAIVPGHDLGIAIIIFTALIRLALWPLVKRQLHQAKAMRRLQPKLKELKKAAGGDRQKEARLQMELYKEHGVKPFSTIGTLIIQLPIFIALYRAVFKLTEDPNTLLTHSYDFVRHLPWIEHLAQDITKFDYYFLGFADLSKNAFGDSKIYFPALLIAIVAAIAQFYQSRLMALDRKDSKKLTEILRDASTGKQADQAEISAAISKNMMYLFPVLTFIFAASLPSALGLYIFTTSAVGYFQQRHVLKDDEEEMHKLAEEPTKSEKQAAKKPRNKKAKSKKNRRKK